MMDLGGVWMAASLCQPQPFSSEKRRQSLGGRFHHATGGSPPHFRGRVRPASKHALKHQRNKEHPYKKIRRNKGA